MLSERKNSLCDQGTITENKTENHRMGFDSKSVRFGLEWGSNDLRMETRE